jgi:hypothetical protein
MDSKLNKNIQTGPNIKTHTYYRMHRRADPPRYSGYASWLGMKTVLFGEV